MLYGYEIFHENIIRSLIESVRTESTVQAYIFEGDKRLGTLEAAKLFAKALCCEHSSSAPCGGCGCCIEADSGTNPDIVVFEKPKDRQTVGAEQLRELIEDVYVKPFGSRKKVYIIPDGDALTPAAQNAFLKTLEEPPEYAVFIILVSQRDTLLDTVVSRSALIHFPPVSEDTVREYIEEHFPECGNKDFVVKYSEGIPGRAAEITNDAEFYTLRDAALEMLPYLLTKSRIAAFDIQKFLNDNKDDAVKIPEIWLSYLRDMLVIKLASPERLINSDKLSALEPLAHKLDARIIASAIDECVTAEKMLARYVSIKAVGLRLALSINRD